ncbi:MAG: CDGSH iron-sulfur domain-containing protein [Armatimonadota bacterium]|nr:CDGSH iron-sulfur domain-containing protein [Armatimonadota bacterium]
MSECTIRIRENGPLLVSGTYTLVDKDGTPYTVEKETIALCRCGHSEEKPYCDGAHKGCEFVAESLAR